MFPPPLPEGAAPGSQYTRRAADYVARMRLHWGSTQARGQKGSRVLLAVRDNYSSRLRWLSSLYYLQAQHQALGPPGGRGPGQGAPPPPPPPMGATSGQRHQESSDPIEVGPVRREARQESRRPHRRRGNVEDGGDRRRTEDGACAKGRISTRTRARTRAAARTGERVNRPPSGAAPPQQAVERFTPPAPQVGPVPCHTETPLPPQPEQGVMTSSAATRLGSRPTPILFLGRSRVPVGEPSLSRVETASTPRELRRRYRRPSRGRGVGLVR